MALVQYLYYLPRTLGNTVKPLLKDCHIKKCSTYILHIDRSYILRHPSTLRTPPSMSTRRGKNIPWNNPHCHSRYRSFREKLVRLDRSFISIRLSQDFEDLKLLQELVHVYPTSWPSLQISFRGLRPRLMYIEREFFLFIKIQSFVRAIAFYSKF